MCSSAVVACCRWPKVVFEPALRLTPLRLRSDSLSRVRAPWPTSWSSHVGKLAFSFWPSSSSPSSTITISFAGFFFDLRFDLLSPSGSYSCCQDRVVGGRRSWE